MGGSSGAAANTTTSESGSLPGQPAPTSSDPAQVSSSTTSAAPAASVSGLAAAVAPGLDSRSSPRAQAAADGCERQAVPDSNQIKVPTGERESTSSNRDRVPQTNPGRRRLVLDKDVSRRLINAHIGAQCRRDALARAHTS